jgi:phosphoglucomutase
LLAAEITAQTKRDPGEAYDHLTRELGVPFYERIDAPAAAEDTLAQSDRHDGTCRRANTREAYRRSGNGLPFGGIRVIAENGWFAARPSGTEDIYKIYAESFRSEDHLRQIQQEVKNTIVCVFENAKADSVK